MRLESESDFQLRLLRAWKAYRTAVAAHPELKGLSPEHAADVAVVCAKQANGLVDAVAALIASGAHDRARTILATNVQALQRDDPLLFERAPLKGYLHRLMIAARDNGLGAGGDNDSLAAAADSINVEAARRYTYALHKALSAAGIPIPSPSPLDTNVALQRPGIAGTPQPPAAPLDPANSPAVLMRSRRARFASTVNTIGGTPNTAQEHPE